jgi:hypothetical protein
VVCFDPLHFDPTPIVEDIRVRVCVTMAPCNNLQIVVLHFNPDFLYVFCNAGYKMNCNNLPMLDNIDLVTKVMCKYGVLRSQLPSSISLHCVFSVAVLKLARAG